MPDNLESLEELKKLLEQHGTALDNLIECAEEADKIVKGGNPTEAAINAQLESMISALKNANRTITGANQLAFIRTVLDENTVSSTEQDRIWETVRENIETLEGCRKEVAEIIASTNDKKNEIAAARMATIPPPQARMMSPTIIGRTNIPTGLERLKIPGDGHCFFNAVEMYLGKPNEPSNISGGDSERPLRERVASYIEENFEHFVDFYTGNADALRAHIADIRSTNEYADNLEIEAIQAITGRPIIIVQPNSYVGLDILEKYTDDPIFLYYDGHIHYDALTIKPGFIVADILKEMWGNLAPTTTATNPAAQRATTTENACPTTTHPIAGVDNEDIDNATRTEILKKIFLPQVPTIPGMPTPPNPFATTIKNIAGIGSETKLTNIELLEKSTTHRFTFENTIASTAPNKQPKTETIIALRQKNAAGEIEWRTSLDWEKNCALIAAMQHQLYQDPKVQATMRAEKQDSAAIQLGALQLTEDEKKQKANLTGAPNSREGTLIKDNLSVKEHQLINAFFTAGFKEVHYTLQNNSKVTVTKATWDSLNAPAPPVHVPPVVVQATPPSPPPPPRSEHELS